MDDYIEVDMDNNLYPDRLKEIKNTPKKLYMQGNYELVNHSVLAIVGSRECTDYGFRMAYEFSKELSKKGICIVSGLAEGIDTAAHLGAMHQVGNTVAVLGSGLQNISPEENNILAKSIIKNDGLIITEYDLYEEAQSQNFPQRNRIMSGLASGVLVIEGKNRSGSLITVRYAKEQKKKIFCLPGNIGVKSGGTNLLIKEGAILVTCVDDILNELIQEPQEQKINSEYRKIYDILNDYPMNINEICKITGLQMGEVNQIVTMLEIEGLIKSLPNNEVIKCI